MKENTQEKSLVQVNKNSIFYKIKSFFINLFHKNTEIESSLNVEEDISSNVEIENKRLEFIDKVIKTSKTISFWRNKRRRIIRRTNKFTL